MQICSGKYIVKNLKIKYISAQNFLCFGSDGIEINLENYDNIVLIRGRNLDVLNDNENLAVATNGIGKSSIPEIIVYTLFGKTIKQPKKISHNDVINNITKKKLKTEIVWDKYRVVRTRKPDSLRIWESEQHVWDDSTEITLGGIPTTQKLIEDKIGLTYDSFVNLVIFTDNNSGSFLECDIPTKREIVENLLSLGKYREYVEIAKDYKKKFNDNIKLKNNEFNIIINEIKLAKERLANVKKEESNWKQNKLKEISTLKDQLDKKKIELEKTDYGNLVKIYEDAQNKIIELKNDIVKCQDTQEKFNILYKDLQEKLVVKANEKETNNKELNDSSVELNDLTIKINKNSNKIEKLSNHEDDVNCEHCFSNISKKNKILIIEQCNKELKKYNIEKNNIINKIELLNVEKNNILKLIKSLQDTENKIKKEIENSTRKITSDTIEIAECSKITKPEGSHEEIIIKEQIDNIKSKMKEKLAEASGVSPYKQIMDNAEKDIVDKETYSENIKTEVKNMEDEIAYYDFWIKAFGDNGIRKFIIDGIIPALNSKISYWMQILIDGKIKLEFNNQLEEKIERIPNDGDPFIYYVMSGGERRRLNLAVSQAFAHIMSLSAGFIPSLVFLDEVTTNIDSIGVSGVYNMILELAKEKQCFITTHDQGLLDMLQGCQTINLEKKNGFTTLVSP